MKACGHQVALSNSYHCVLTVVQGGQNVDTGRVELHDTRSSDEDAVKFITSVGLVCVVIAEESGVFEF